MNTLPNEKIYEICQKMDDKTLANFMMAEKNVHDVCSEIMAKRRVDYDEFNDLRLENMELILEHVTGVDSKYRDPDFDIQLWDDPLEDRNLIFDNIQNLLDQVFTKEKIIYLRDCHIVDPYLTGKKVEVCRDIPVLGQTGNEILFRDVVQMVVNLRMWEENFENDFRALKLIGKKNGILVFKIVDSHSYDKEFPHKKSIEDSVRFDDDFRAEDSETDTDEGYEEEFDY